MDYRIIENDSNSKVIFYLIDDPDSGIEEMLKEVKATFVLVKAESWNDDLTPWPARVMKMNFAGRADQFRKQLKDIVSKTSGKDNVRYLGGYSLAGLFALYCHDDFDGVVSCSGSLWYPDFVSYFQKQPIRQGKPFYLSLGDTEAKTRNPVMAEVGNATESIRDYLKQQGADCFFEYNEGGHFNHPEQRMLKGIRWMMAKGEER